MKKLLALAFFTLFIPAFPTHAEDSVSAPFSFSQPTQATVIATTSIYDAKIISQNKSNLSLSFVLGNREGEQPSVIYAVALTSKDGKTADLKVYDDPVSLSSNIMIQKNIEYQAPGYLSGSYQVMIVAKNPDGLILAMNRVGEITVSGTGEYVDASGCYLRVNGEDKRYTLLHGVDVENNESLIAHCTLKNSFKRSITATPAMETRFRSAFGKKIDFRKMDPITLEPGQSIEKDFTITKPNDPQSYDALLSFYDQNDNIISNVTDFHYVLRGLSATVQNVILDKDYYQKGDNANLSFIWTGSADSFPDSRKGASSFDGSYSASISSGNTACADNLKGTVSMADSNIRIEKPFAITNDCPDPKVSVSILDQDGKVLGQGDFQFKSNSLLGKDTNPESMPSGNDQGSNTRSKLIAALLILTLILVSAIIFKYRKKGSVKAIVFLTLSASFLAVAGVAKADTFSSGYSMYTVSIDKSVYSPGETITASGDNPSYGLCANAEAIPGTGLSASLNGYKKVFYIFGCSHDGSNYDNYVNPECVGMYSLTFTAPTNPGRYEIIFTGLTSKLSHIGNWEMCNGSISHAIPFTVVGPPPVNGSCGSANGQLFNTRPTANLCSSGTLGDFWGTGPNVEVGPWGWYCNGSNGGVRVQCASGTSPINGECGPSSGGTFSSVPTTGLCDWGYTGTVYDRGNYWDWICSPKQGGTERVTCSANKDIVNGKCGSANGSSLTSKPTTNLCDAGNASAVSGSGPWSWNCNGINGGKNVSCSASKTCVPKYTYTCDTSSGSCGSDCGEKVVSNSCIKNDGCGHTYFVDHSECSGTCSGSHILDCGVCGSGQWQEVKPE